MRNVFFNSLLTKYSSDSRVNLPELPSEQQIAKWLQSCWKQTGRYAGTVWRALCSPTSLVRHWMQDRSVRETKAQVAPFPFIVLTLVFASLLQNVAVATLGVEKPFFGHFAYYARLRLYEDAVTSLEKLLPLGFSVSVVLRSLEFAIVLLVVVLWARTLTRNARRYWADIAALSYLLPIVLIVDIVDYCAMNLTFRVIGDDVLLFVGATSLFMLLFPLIAYGLLLRVVDRVYFFATGWRRAIHLTGYVMVVPVILFFLKVAFYVIPVGFSVYRVASPTVEGESQLSAGDYKAAEKLFAQAIRNDPSGVLSSHAHIRFVSVSARRILALLPDVSGDSSMRERLLHHFVQIDPFRRVMDVWRPEGSIDVSPPQLFEFRDAILNSFLTARDIPVTNSELNCALRSTATDEDCNELPKEVIRRYKNTPAERQGLYYLIYRARALRGEPTTADARRYIQFLWELPIRIEIMFVRYRALNLMRESETLATLDDLDRSGNLDRDFLIKGNREILSHDYKYPHLKIPDDEIEKLSERELGFHMRQAYLNYLRAQARLLVASRISGESSLIRQQATSVEEHLTWVANEGLYRDIPPANRVEQALLKLFGMESEVLNTRRADDASH